MSATQDLHICGACRSEFTDVMAFIKHMDQCSSRKTGKGHDATAGQPLLNNSGNSESQSSSEMSSELGSVYPFNKIDVKLTGLSAQYNSKMPAYQRKSSQRGATDYNDCRQSSTEGIDVYVVGPKHQLLPSLESQDQRALSYTSGVSNSKNMNSRPVQVDKNEKTEGLVNYKTNYTLFRRSKPKELCNEPTKQISTQNNSQSSELTQQSGELDTYAPTQTHQQRQVHTSRFCLQSEPDNSTPCPEDLEVGEISASVLGGHNHPQTTCRTFGVSKESSTESSSSPIEAQQTGGKIVDVVPAKSSSHQHALSFIREKTASAPTVTATSARPRKRRRTPQEKRCRLPGLSAAPEDVASSVASSLSAASLVSDSVGSYSAGAHSLQAPGHSFKAVFTSLSRSGHRLSPATHLDLKSSAKQVISEKPKHSVGPFKQVISENPKHSVGPFSNLTGRPSRDGKATIYKNISASTKLQTRSAKKTRVEKKTFDRNERECPDKIERGETYCSTSGTEKVSFTDPPHSGNEAKDVVDESQVHVVVDVGAKNEEVAALPAPVTVELRDCLSYGHGLNVASNAGKDSLNITHETSAYTHLSSSRGLNSAPLSRPDETSVSIGSSVLPQQSLYTTLPSTTTTVATTISSPGSIFSHAGGISSTQSPGSAQRDVTPAFDTDNTIVMVYKNGDGSVVMVPKMVPHASSGGHLRPLQQFSSDNVDGNDRRADDLHHPAALSQTEHSLVVSDEERPVDQIVLQLHQDGGLRQHGFTSDSVEGEQVQVQWPQNSLVVNHGQLQQQGSNLQSKEGRQMQTQWSQNSVVVSDLPAGLNTLTPIQEVNQSCGNNKTPVTQIILQVHQDSLVQQQQRGINSSEDIRSQLLATQLQGNNGQLATCHVVSATESTHTTTHQHQRTMLSNTVNMPGINPPTEQPLNTTPHIMGSGVDFQKSSPAVAATAREPCILRRKKRKVEASETSPSLHKQEAQEGCEEKKQRLYICKFDKCSFQSTALKDFQRHYRIHTGEKPYKCLICEKAFSRSDKLRSHIRWHDGTKPHQCHLCDYKTLERGSLKKHLRIHSDERPYKCQVCPYASRNSSHLTVHLRKHTGDSPFKCSECGAKFKINSDLKRHMRIHTGEKPFSCDQCDYRSTNKGNLNTHKRINHSATNEMRCSQCEFTTSSRKRLREHTKTHKVAAEGGDAFKCQQCGHTCSTASALRAHLCTHDTLKPYQCSFCPYACKQSGNLKKHVQSQHLDKLQRSKRRSARSKGKGQHAVKGSKSSKVSRSEVSAETRTGSRSPSYSKQHACSLCDSKFVRLDSLRSHLNQHRMDGADVPKLPTLTPSHVPVIRRHAASHHTSNRHRLGAEAVRSPFTLSASSKVFAENRLTLPSGHVAPPGGSTVPPSLSSLQESRHNSAAHLPDVGESPSSQSLVKAVTRPHRSTSNIDPASQLSQQSVPLSGPSIVGPGAQPFPCSSLPWEHSSYTMMHPAKSNLSSAWHCNQQQTVDIKTSLPSVPSLIPDPQIVSSTTAHVGQRRAEENTAAQFTSLPSTMSTQSAKFPCPSITEASPSVISAASNTPNSTDTVGPVYMIMTKPPSLQHSALRSFEMVVVPADVDQSLPDGVCTSLPPSQIYLHPAQSGAQAAMIELPMLEGGGEQTLVLQADDTSYAEPVYNLQLVPPMGPGQINSQVISIPHVQQDGNNIQIVLPGATIPGPEVLDSSGHHQSIMFQVQGNSTDHVEVVSMPYAEMAVGSDPRTATSVTAVQGTSEAGDTNRQSHESRHAASCSGSVVVDLGRTVTDGGDSQGEKLC